MDVSTTPHDVHLTTPSSSLHPAYSLHVAFPAQVDEDGAEAKFHRKKHTLTLRLPVITPSAPRRSPAASGVESKAMAHEEKGSEEMRRLHAEEPARVSAAASSEGGQSPAASPVIDWVSRLSLRNSLIAQPCI